MMTTFRLAGLAAGCALALSLTPALAQTTAPATPPATAPAAPPATQEPGARQMPDMDAMREMMRRHPEGPQGARRIGTKDLSLAVRLGRELGLEVPIAEFFAGRPWT